jgi:hypothetical protein
MNRARSSALILILGAVAVVAGVNSGRFASARAETAHVPSAMAVVQKYFRSFNAGMRSGNFSTLRSVYQPNAVLTQSNPFGETKVSHGLDQIIAFYQAAYAKFDGYHWTQDSTRLLAKNVVLNYEFAGIANKGVPGRCAHVFVIRKGKIASLDWITFYSGQQ